ncbi:LytTR family DNA-binding domain-containing protein [Danxiaibacter flavus]|uniref:LytTR family DNA-binding domain-containing protein n=1 Tax=Danxiaibacter flavus TaxID=3049108 RepID=A0ABV3ZBL5_9BACT|nr:LytTR family DNA-binding domain-containing protein [Chitinophagaceae bacterium DXS]
MMINCAIIDDEPLARKGLKEYIADMDFLNLVGEYDTPLKAVEQIKAGKIQLLFLDIQMPRLSGLEFLKTMTNPPLTVITTAYPEYALEGFELDVLDYLVKPIAFNRFVKAAMKAKEYLSARTATPSAEDDFIFIKADNKLVKVYYDDILFVEATQNYVTIFTKTKKYITYLTFKSIEEALPASRFLRVHKSFIVQLSKVESVDGNELVIDTHKIPVSRANKDEVMQKILSGKFLKR